MKKGIYTLANNVIYDQLVALLNSIEANYGQDIPVCVIPYDDQLEKVIKEIKNRDNVHIFNDNSSIQKWEKFAERVWSYHPHAFSKWKEKKIKGVYRMGMHRRYCAFDGPFENFAFLDGDTLVMQSFDHVFEKLIKADFVTYDYQFKDPSHVYDVNSPLFSNIFSEELMTEKMFCAGFYVSKKGLFSPEKCEKILESLKKEAGILYINGPDQSLLNYMIMKLNIKNVNMGRILPYERRTGNSAHSSHFEAKEHLLYDRGNLLTYLHYIGISSSVIKEICLGEDIDIPYKDIFLHYRYLSAPDKRPAFKGKPVAEQTRVNLWKKFKRWLK